MHSHHLVTARVDHLHCDALVLARREWQRNSAREHLEPLRVHHAGQGFAELVPRAAVRKERLGDAKRAPVVIAVHEPRRHFRRAGIHDGVVHGIVDVHAFHLHGVHAVAVRRADLGARAPEDGEQLAAGLLFQEAVHAGVHIGADVRDVHPKTRHALADDSVGGTVETEPGKNEVGVAARVRLDDLFDHLRGDGTVLRAEYHADRGLALGVVIGFAGIHPSPFGMDARRTAGSVDRIEARELLLLVIREADAVHAEQVHHLAQVRFEVLGRLAHLHFPNGERVRQFVGLAGEARFDNGGVTQRHLRWLDCFHRERSTDTSDFAVYLRLVYQLFLISVCGDAGVDLVHLGAPRGAVFLDCLLEVARVIRVGVERNLPMLPTLALGWEFPPASVSIGDALFTTLFL